MTKLIKIDGKWIQPEAVKKVELYRDFRIDQPPSTEIDLGNTAVTVNLHADDVAERINNALEGPKYVLDFGDYKAPTVQDL